MTTKIEEIQHSPTPWYWDDTKTHWVIRDVTGFQVATGIYCSTDPYETNARLFYATPELLKVCIELLKTLDKNTGREVSDVTRNEMEHLRKMARRVYNKIKGA